MVLRCFISMFVDNVGPVEAVLSHQKYASNQLRGARALVLQTRNYSLFLGDK